MKTIAVAGCVVWATLWLTPTATGMQAATPTSGAVDPATGRDLLNYPPDPGARFERMRLEISIPNMDTPRAQIVQTLTIAAVGTPIAVLSLDARLLDIRGVESAGRLVGHRHDGRTLTITLDPPIEVGRSAEIVTSYQVSDPPRGIVWTPSDPAYPGRAAQLHTQGQTEFNSYWFPIRDFPNVRLSTEIIATVPTGFEVVSNGRLVERTAVGPGRVRFHWSQERPHPPYLVSLVVGQFDVVDVARAGSVPMPVYVPPGRGRDVERTYGRTALMAELFARLIDEPYPWEKYAQVVVHNFEAGGMENTSATTMHDTAILTADGVADQDIEGLIAHELAHQWFGNMITCRSWEHLWLNEGFATYFEALWLERQPLPPERGLRRPQRQWSGRDLYLTRVLEALDAFRKTDLPDAPRQPAMVSKEYRHADETFARAADPYSKGAFVLHMLRAKLGDEVFFRGLAAYVDRFAFKEVETNDFRRVMEEVSGETLEAFFAQWCFRPGVPTLEITPAWEPRAGGGGDLNITVRQTQRMDRENPAFSIDLPVWVRSAGAEQGAVVGAVRLRGPQTVARFALPASPEVIAIDPELTVAANVSVATTVAQRIAQLRTGPTVVSRIAAARQLAGDPGAATIEALSAVAVDATLLPALRAEAVRALAKSRAAGPIEALARQRIAEADVRLAVVEAVGSLAIDSAVSAEIRARLAAIVRTAAAGDSFGRSRAAALRALGAMGGADALAILRQAADTPSDHDRVRRGAIDGLAALGTREALPVVLRAALPGSLQRTREQALRAIPRLARHDPDAALSVLSSAASERTPSIWATAGRTLVELGDPRGVAVLETLRDSRRDEFDRLRAGDWLDALRAKVGGPAASNSELGGVGVVWIPWGEASAVPGDPAAHFAARGLVADVRDGTVLLLTRAGESVGGAERPLVVAGSRLIEDGGRVRAIELSLDAASAVMVRGFTSSLVGGRVVVAVAERARGVVAVTSPLGPAVQIAGPFGREEAQRIAKQAREPGGVRLRVAVRPGERQDEAALREQLRSGR